MVSVWWLIWAFVIGGYAGMLVIALIVVARRTGNDGSTVE
jgi:RsiW-degrading membrane proteinase PrsW (M82 family)